LINRQLQLIAPFEAYLASAPLIDVEHAAIQEFVATRPQGAKTDEQVAHETFRFVRDEIKHSWDVLDPRVTAKASEVLELGVGICYAKSHLLAALLRAYGIPSGLCYQRLTLGDTPESGFCIHGLNSVYLASHNRWIRLDSRGNKPGVDAQFSIDTEHLAFEVREELGEMDYLINFASPHPSIVTTLASSSDAIAMCNYALPTHLDLTVLTAEH